MSSQKYISDGETVLNTTILFRLLLKSLNPALVLDIGSMDGGHSLIFRSDAPTSRIVAFEANPRNAEKMINNPAVQSSNIEVQQLAVSDKNGEISFFIASTDPASQEAWRHAASSTLRRAGETGETGVTATTVRLDEQFRNLDDSVRVALWVDVEGAAYQALAGAERLKEKVDIIHVEVETEEVWEGQKLKKDVVQLLGDYGFLQLARGRKEQQHDLVLVSGSLYSKNLLKIRIVIRLAQAMSAVRKVGGRVLGNGLFSAMRSAIPSGWLQSR